MLEDETVTMPWAAPAGAEGTGSSAAAERADAGDRHAVHRVWRSFAPSRLPQSVHQCCHEHKQRSTAHRERAAQHTRCHRTAHTKHAEGERETHSAHQRVGHCGAIAVLTLPAWWERCTAGALQEWKSRLALARSARKARATAAV